MSFASPYKGSGRGYVYTMSSVRLNSSGNGGGVLAQAPVASMGSTSSSASHGIVHGGTAAMAMPQIAGIRTAASSIQGGVTTAQVYPHIGGIRRGKLPGGNPPGCDCDWQEVAGGYECTKCHSFVSEDDYLDSHIHTGDCPCYVPLDFNWATALFMAILATAYGVYKKRTSTL